MKCGATALDVLDSVALTLQNRNLLHRFRGNACHVIGEIHLFTRNLNIAEQSFARSHVEYEAFDVSVHRNLSDARLSIARAEVRDALGHLEKFRTDLISTRAAERWEEYYRILGDCHALAKDLDAAMYAYGQVIPRDRLELSPQATLAMSRIRALKHGKEAREFLNTGPL